MFESFYKTDSNSFFYGSDGFGGIFADYTIEPNTEGCLKLIKFSWISFEIDLHF